ncbi:3-hydroxyacyl-CoA dehydrogenase family protein [Thermodesulfobacteriota bacterium]
MANEVKVVSVLGAGIMGSGIAQTIAQSGLYSVHMVDINQPALDKGMKNIEKSIERFIKKGSFSKEEGEAVISRITATREFDVVGETDLVVEAIPENLALKIETFKKLSEQCPDRAILGSNTSSLPIASIASATNRPEKVIGIHFMNPVPIIKGVEVIKASMTSAETIRKTISFLESIGKEPCLALDFPGFVNSRLLNLYMNEAVFAVMDGNTPEEVDKVMVHTANMPIGPLRLADMVGLDVHLNVMDILRKEYGERFRVAPLTRQMVRAGSLGQKTGQGFYKY